jgi:hypothetical protein
MTVTVSIDDSVVATLSGSRFSENITVAGTGSFEQGISGSLTQLVDGRSYLVAGSNVTITSASNGQVTIAASIDTGSIPSTPQYITLTTDATLTAERILTAGSGITLVDAGAKSTETVQVTNSYIANQILRRSLRRPVSFSIIGAGGSISTQKSDNAFNRIYWTYRTTATTDNAQAGYLQATAGQNSASRVDGFVYTCVFGFGTWTTTNRKSFCGLTSSTPSTTSPINSTVQPSALPNIICVAMNSADTQLYIMHNDGTGTATKVATGYTAGSNTGYAVRFICAPSGNIGYILHDILARTQISGVLTTDLPATTVQLRACTVGSNGASAGGVAVNVYHSLTNIDTHMQILGVSSF